MRYKLVKSPIRPEYKIVNIDEQRRVQQLTTAFVNNKDLDVMFTHLEKYQEISICWSPLLMETRSADIIAEADTLEDLKQKVTFLFL